VAFGQRGLDFAGTGIVISMLEGTDLPHRALRVQQEKIL